MCECVRSVSFFPLIYAVLHFLVKTTTTHSLNRVTRFSSETQTPKYVFANKHKIGFLLTCFMFRFLPHPQPCIIVCLYVCLLSPLTFRSTHRDNVIMAWESGGSQACQTCLLPVMNTRCVNITHLNTCLFLSKTTSTSTITTPTRERRVGEGKGKTVGRGREERREGTVSLFHEDTKPPD